MNRVIVIMELEGVEAAFKALHEIGDEEQLDKYYLYHALLGDLYHKSGDDKNAAQSLEKALTLTQSEREKEFLMKRIRLARAGK